MWPFRKTETLSPVAQADPSEQVRQLAEYLVNQNFAEGSFRIGIPGLGNQRNRVVQYATLARCATLITSICAQLVCSNGLTVRDRDDRRVDNRRTRNVLDVLCWSPDGRETPAHTFIEDVMMDYCLDGNSLVVPSSVATGSTFRLTRYRSYDAHIVYGPNREMLYQMLRADNDHEGSEYHAARDVMHVRWPRLLRYGLTTNSREQFALAPVVALSNALGIGIKGDLYIDDWFSEGSKPGLHVNVTTQEGKASLTAEQRALIAEEVKKAVKSKEALVTFDAESRVIDTSPQDRAAKELRDFQVQEVARYFGVPLPLLSVNLDQWSRSTTEQIMKVFWRTGLRPHLGRLLSAFELRLLMPGERFHADEVDLIRGDAEGLTRLVMAMQGDTQRAPVATRQELRHMAGLPRDPEGEFALPMAPEGGEGAPPAA